jgi:hypothetical protein
MNESDLFLAAVFPNDRKKISIQTNSFLRGSFLNNKQQANDGEVVLVVDILVGVVL